MKIKFVVEKCEVNCGEFISVNHSTWDDINEAIDTHFALERRAEHGIFYEIKVQYKEDDNEQV